MRRDIHINTEINDLEFANADTREPMTFRWTIEQDLNVIGEIVLSRNYNINLLYSEGVIVAIPYLPIYKTVKFRVLQTTNDNRYEPVVNLRNNTEYFDLVSSDGKSLYASQLPAISLDLFCVAITDYRMVAYSGKQTDFEIINADLQNRDMLLQCVESNNYRYPTSGVGLIRYLHSNIANSDLASKLYSEFEADGVKIRNAAFDAEKGKLELDLNFDYEDV